MENESSNSLLGISIYQISDILPSLILEANLKIIPFIFLSKQNVIQNRFGDRNITNLLSD